MYEMEYRHLIQKREDSLITAFNLNNLQDRTLLYGYDCARITHHVYLKNRKIYAVVYDYNKELVINNIHKNEDYVPNKRLYPARCDFEFCCILKDKGIYLPFTTFTTSEMGAKPDGVYYGRILNES